MKRGDRSLKVPKTHGHLTVGMSDGFTPASWSGKDSVPWRAFPRRELFAIRDRLRYPSRVVTLLNPVKPKVHGLHCSKAEISQLRPITLSETRYPNVHTGRYILCLTASHSMLG